MDSVKSEECDLEKDGHVDVDAKQKSVDGGEKQSDSLSSREAIKTPEGEPATEEEIKNLFHVVDDIPTGVWLASFVASAERFAWFGATGPLRKASRQNLYSHFHTNVVQKITSNMIATARSREHWVWSKPLRL